VAPTTAAPSPTPLSPYENDPGVKALRKFYAAAAKAINVRNLRHPDLVAMSTPKRQARNEVLFKTELGLRVPGPIPFTPVAVRSNGSTSRTILYCGLDEGFSLDPKTGKPARPRSVVPVAASMVRIDGRWKVDSLTSADFSCVGVKV
jgi:hypothetical protein